MHVPKRLSKELLFYLLIKDYLDNTVAVEVNIGFSKNGENIMIIDMTVDQYQFRYFYDRDKLTLKMLMNDEIV